MKKIVLLSAAVLFTLASKAQIYMAKTSEITFFSEARLENIDAKNTTGKPVMDAKSGRFSVKVSMKGFKFKSGLMEEHFNETYVESDKFPYAVFEGKIKDNDKIDYTKDGVYDVVVEGKMTMHGETKDVTVTGKLTIKGTQILIDSKFKIKLADYKVIVPSGKLANIAETVDVTIKSTLDPFKK
ncbi:MAG: YceI family protein [Bacteroidetes bacterium]|nr:YceI family protein [Bacteroidota bacterium]